MDPRKPRHSTTSPGTSGGRYLQGVWMSRCEGGRVERLTKWSDDRRDKTLGSLDRQEHDSLVKMNMVRLEVKEELATLNRSRRLPLKVARDGRRVDAQVRPRVNPVRTGSQVLTREVTSRPSQVKVQDTLGSDDRKVAIKTKDGQFETRKVGGSDVVKRASKGKLGRHQPDVSSK